MANTPANPSGEPLVIAITGGSGSGKTTFAELLRKKLEPDAIVLAHDDYYKHLPDMTREEAATYDFDSPDALETDLLVEHLRMLKGGRAVDVPSYNFATHARTEGARHVEPAPVILVEGLLVTRDPTLFDLFDLLIFLDTDADVRALRRVERDCQERGTDLSRAVAMYLATSKPAYDAHIEPLKRKADIVIPNMSNERALDVVAGGIRNLHESSHTAIPEVPASAVSYHDSKPSDPETGDAA